MNARYVPTGQTRKANRWVLAWMAVLIAGLGGLLAGCSGTETTSTSASPTSTTTALLSSTTTAATTQTMHWERLLWTQRVSGLSTLVMDPTNPSVLYAGTDDGLFRSSDGAESWSRLPTPVGWVCAISIDPASPSTVYAGLYSETDGATHLLRTDDGGVTWVDLIDKAAPKIGGAGWTWVSPEVWFDTTSTPSTAYMRGSDWQVYLSTDRGKTWIGLTQAEQDEAAALQDASRSRPPAAQQAVEAFLASNGVPFGDGVEAAATDADTGYPLYVDATMVIVDPDHPSTFYLAMDDGVYKSVNGGKTWRQANSGLVATVVWGMVVDPREPSTLYVATPRGIFKSSDGGTTWSMSLGGPVARCSVVIAPSSPSTLYAWTAVGLYHTDDGGTNWNERGGVFSIPFHAPRTTAGSLILVAADNPDIVFAMTDLLSRSTNGGSTWHQVPAEARSAGGGGLLVADPDHPSTLFAVLPGAFGVLKSTDAGATWTALPMQWDDPVVDIAVDPHAPSAVYAIKYHAGSGAYAPSRSLDGGATWQKVALGDLGENVCRVLFDPRSPDTMYVFTDVGSASAALHRSTDGGATWANITGELGDSMVVDVVIDPASSEGLYAITASGLYKWVQGE